MLEEAGVPSPRADAELLAAHLLGIERTRLGLVPLVDAAMVDAYRAMIAQRAKRIPLQYITGTSAMGEIDLAVGPGVFVPRPETELLLGWALAFLESYPRRSPVVLTTLGDGRDASLWRLAPHRTPLGQLSPRSLVDTIRRPFRDPHQAGITL